MSDSIQTNNVTYLFRNPKSGFSIHNVFMPIIKLCHASYYDAPCERADIRSIISNLIWVRKIASLKGINHMTGGFHYFLLAIPFRRNVLTIHDLVLLKRSKGIKRLIFKYFWFIFPVKCSKVVTCITETVRQQLINTIPIDPLKVHTIYNPVSPLYQFFEKKFNQDKPRILHIGTAWNKNTTSVIKALETISCKLIIIGELNQNIVQALKESKTDYDVMQDLSNEELYIQYKEADIISFPSIFEGFGMPIIEGQATGRPVLTSNIPPMTEIAGQGACFVNPHKIESIRNGFIKIINDSDYRSQIIKNGLENVKRFSVETISEQYNSLYKTI